MNEQQNALKPGTILRSPKREYVIEKVLGQGGFGITYKAVWATKIENVPVKIHFAIKEFFMNDSCERDADTNSKVLYSSPVKNKVEESRRDFISEATRLNSLSKDHPSIVRVNEVFEANNTAYYVMEFLEGGSLRNYVRQNGALSEKDALGIILPVIEAVETLHQSKITHLDIKPDNIMLKPNSDGGITPVLIDFGLSKHYDNKGNPTSTIRAVGISAGYAPLEQYTGITTFTPQADVYGLGATLYYQLVGRDPAIASDIRPDIIEKALPQGVSDVVKQALLQAMKMFKDERTQSAGEFAQNLTRKQPQEDNKDTSESTASSTSQSTTVIIDTHASGNGGNTNIGSPENTSDFTNTSSIHNSREITPVVRKNRLPLWIGIGVVAIVIIILALPKGSKNEEADDIVYEDLVDVKFQDNEYGKAFTYSGSWTLNESGDTVPNGNGIAIYNDGSRYEGEFSNGMRHGNATYIYSNGDKFEGVFDSNHLSKGRYTAKEGTYFEGTFTDDSPAQGEWHEANGRLINVIAVPTDSI